MKAYDHQLPVRPPHVRPAVTPEPSPFIPSQRPGHDPDTIGVTTSDDRGRW